MLDKRILIVDLNQSYLTTQEPLVKRANNVGKLKAASTSDERMLRLNRSNLIVLLYVNNNKLTLPVIDFSGWFIMV